MKTLVVNQPAGVGDLIFVQPILEHFITNGFKIILPVIERYFLMAKKYLPRNGLEYVGIDEDYPFKSVFDNPNVLNDGIYTYLPLAHSHRHFNNCPLMLSKYVFSQVPLVDYRKYIPKIRDFNRELKLMKLMNIDNEKFCLVNKLFGTPPQSNEREISLPPEFGRIIEIDYREELQAEFHPFDWIGMIQAANSIHFVQTSLSFIADIYAQKETTLHLYDRVARGNSPIFFRNVEFVQRHPSWIYHV